MKVISLSAISTGHFNPPGNIACTHFCYGLGQRKNSNDTIGNRTGDLSACSAVPQPTALYSSNVSYFMEVQSLELFRIKNNVKQPIYVNFRAKLT